MNKVHEKPSNLPYKNLAEKRKAEGRFKSKSANPVKKAPKPLHKMDGEGLGLKNLFKSTDKAAETAATATASSGKWAKAGKIGLAFAGLGVIAFFITKAIKKNRAAKEEAAKAEAAKQEQVKTEEIVLPETTAEETKAAEEKTPVEHIVKKGENPWAIALEYLKSKNENFDYMKNPEDNKQLLELTNKIMEDNDVKVRRDENGRVIGIIFPGQKLEIEA